MTAPTSSGATSTARPTFFSSSAQERGAPLERRVALLREHGEAAPGARPVLQHAVAVAGRPGRGRPAAASPRRRRSSACGGRGRTSAGCPGVIGPVDRHRRAQEDRVGERLAIDRVRDGAPQLAAQQPRPRLRGRPAAAQVQPERVGVEADPEVHDRHLARVGGPLDRRVVLGPQLGLREVDLPRLQRQHLGVLVGHDLERQPVEHRQPGARRVRSASSAGCARRPAAVPAGTTRGRTARGPASRRAAWRRPTPSSACPRPAPLRACAAAGSAGCRAAGRRGRTATGT